MTETPPRRKRGRPPLIITSEMRVLAERMCAANETLLDTAAALGISIDTLERKFKVEITLGRTRQRAALITKVFEKALEGNASMLKLALEITSVEEKDEPYAVPQAKPVAEPKAPKLGKKEEQALAAANPDVSTRMGELMAARAARGQRVQ